MNISLYIDKFQSFSGNADALIRAATKLSELLSLGIEKAADIDIDNDNLNEDGEVEGNERLLRHYVSMSVVDRPVRKGRDAVYGFRQLLQYLTARRLLKQGFSLSKIAEFTSVVPTAHLSQALIEAPHRSEAELLVAAFKVGESAGARSSPEPVARASRMASSASGIDPIFGMADLLKEIEDLRQRFSVEMHELRRVGDQLQRLNDTVERSMRLGMNAQDQFMQWMADIHRDRRVCEELMSTVTKSFDVHFLQIQAQIQMLSLQLSEHIERTTPQAPQTPPSGDRS
ncbi:hypothetical protein MCEMSEM47_01361 [Burkholderiales bacterium]